MLSYSVWNETLRHSAAMIWKQLSSRLTPKWKPVESRQSGRSHTSPCEGVSAVTQVSVFCLGNRNDEGGGAELDAWSVCYLNLGNDFLFVIAWAVRRINHFKLASLFGHRDKRIIVARFWCKITTIFTISKELWRFFRLKRVNQNYVVRHLFLTRHASAIRTTFSRVPWRFSTGCRPHGPLAILWNCSRSYIQIILLNRRDGRLSARAIFEFRAWFGSSGWKPLI